MTPERERLVAAVKEAQLDYDVRCWGEHFLEVRDGLLAAKSALASYDRDHKEEGK